jgi:hypothetical protein
MNRRNYKKFIAEKQSVIIEKSKWRLGISPMIGLGYSVYTLALPNIEGTVYCWQFLFFQLGRVEIIAHELVIDNSAEEDFDNSAEENFDNDELEEDF